MKTANVLKITVCTIRDQLRHKSVYLLLGIAILFILMVRGCYDGDFKVNGKTLDSVTIAWHVSKIVFHVIVSGMVLMSAMLSMKIFSRDASDGSMVLLLCRPVTRRQYLFGRIAGTWVVCTVFMLILHSTIFLMVWAKTGGMIPGYLCASLICSVNLLFVIACVCLLSLFMPDFISTLFTLAILFVGFVSDGGYRLLTSDILKSVLPSSVNPEIPLWRVLYPKIFMVEAYADSIIGQSRFQGMGLVHPLVNVSFFILLLTVLMIWVFNRRNV